MFWACFSYDEKGPCYIWEDETTKEKKKAKEEVDKMNKILEPECKLE
jgi:transposase